MPSLKALKSLKGLLPSVDEKTQFNSSTFLNCHEIKKHTEADLILAGKKEECAFRSKTQNKNHPKTKTEIKQDVKHNIRMIQKHRLQLPNISVFSEQIVCWEKQLANLFSLFAALQILCEKRRNFETWKTYTFPL